MEPRFRVDLQSLRLPADVLAEILPCCPRFTAVETVPLLAADGRVLAEPVHAPRDIPAADTATMDGWLISPDPGDAGSYRIAATLAAGSPPPAEAPQPGHAFRVMTGATLPRAAHAIVRAEDGDEIQGAGEPADVQLQLRIPPPAEGNFIRRRGAEIHRGDPVLTGGTLLCPPHLGVAATMGLAEVQVYRRLRVGLLCSGNELVDRIPVTSGPARCEPAVPAAVTDSTLYNASAPVLLSWLQREGMCGIYLGRLPDDEAATEAMVRQAVDRCDLLLTTGGVSAGMFDYLDDVLQRLGDLHHRYRLRIKPGKPLTFARIGPVPIFALPGNPVSSALSCLRFVRPALYAMLGTEAPDTRTTLPLGRATRSDPELTVYHRATIDDGPAGLRVTPLQGQDSSMLTGLARARVLAEIPPGRGTIPEGEPIQCELFPW